jgi:hypothetical protein
MNWDKIVEYFGRKWYYESVGVIGDILKSYPKK